MIYLLCLYYDNQVYMQWLPPTNLDERISVLNKIVLSTHNGNWYITEGSSANNILLEAQKQKTVRLGASEFNLCLYTPAGQKITYNKYFVDSDKELFIGQNDNKAVSISHTKEDVHSVNIKIMYKGGKYTYTAISGCIYINGKEAALDDKTYTLPLYSSCWLNGVHILFSPGVISAAAFEGSSLNITNKRFEFSLPDVKQAEDKIINFTRYIQIHPLLNSVVEPVDPPPAPKNTNPIPFILQMGAPIAMFASMAVSTMIRVLSGTASGAMAWLAVISLFATTTALILMPRLLRSYQDNKANENEQERVREYTSYLEEIKESLIKERERDTVLWKERYPVPEMIKSYSDIKQNTETKLWSYSPKFKNFVDIRIGVGTRPSLHSIDYKKEGFSIFKDQCKFLVQKLYLDTCRTEDIPVSVEFMKEPIVGIFGSPNIYTRMFLSMITYMATLYSYDEAKIIFLLDRSQKHLHFLRWLPHTFSQDKISRYVAYDDISLNNILDMLWEVFKERKEKKEKSDKDEVFIPHYTMFILSPKYLHNEVLQKRFLSSYDDLKELGFTFVVFNPSMEGIPLISNPLIQCLSQTDSKIFHNDGINEATELFKPDKIEQEDFSVWARKLFRTRVLDLSDNNLIPSSLSFLQMYGVSSVDELNIAERWRKNDINSGIIAPIGINETGLITLNLHEKAHGPHGLIAGTTGSGKSEFIISLVLSLAINYSPEDVSIVILDYKGGSSAKVLKNLPHMCGSITNLGGNQISRSLITIDHEIINRQKLLNSCHDDNINDVYKYTQYRRIHKELKPMPHLFIIADEFAELKREQPAFMDKLISASRIGRSLGIHLILATQKPTGVVNGQIVSNTRFRICLKVADENDSKEMIKTVDAAHITKSGRAYMQVGENEIYSLFQSGYSGVPYLKGAIDSNGVLGIGYLDINGNINESLSAKMKSQKSDGVVRVPTQLESIIYCLKETAEKSSYKKYMLWEEQLPKTISIDEVYKKTEKTHALTRYGFDGKRWNRPKDWMSEGKWMAPVVGIIDDLKEQHYSPFIMDFMKKSHLLAYGMKGSGKTCMIETLVYTLCHEYTPDELNIYIIDYNAGSLSYMQEAPQVGGVIKPGDDFKIKFLMKKLESALNYRKKKFAETPGTSDILIYLEVTKNKNTIKMPAIFVMINNAEMFFEENDTLLQKIKIFVREGAKYGIFFVITGFTPQSIHSSISRYAERIITFEMLDPSNYRNLLGRVAITPEPYPGRAITITDTLVECQIATATDSDNAYTRSLFIIDEFTKMQSIWTGDKDFALNDEIPEELYFKVALNHPAYKNAISKKMLPIGYNTDTAELIYLNNTIKTFAVLGERQKGKSNMLLSIAEIFLRFNKNVRLYIFDSESSSLSVLSDSTLKPAVSYASIAESNTLLETIKNEATSRYTALANDKKTDFSPVVIMIDDCLSLAKNSTGELFNVLASLMINGKKMNYTVYAAASCDKELRNMEFDNSKKTFYKGLLGDNTGILLGGNAYEHDYFKNTLEFKEKTQLYPKGTGLLFLNEKTYKIKTPIYEVENTMSNM